MEIIITSKYSSNKQDVLRAILYNLMQATHIGEGSEGYVRVHGTNEEVHYTVKVAA